MAALGDGRVVSGSRDGTVRVWDLDAGTSRVLEGHQSYVTAVAALGDGRVVSGSRDRTVRVWDLDAGTSRVLQGHQKWMNAVAVLSDGRVVSGSSDKTVRVWDLDAGTSRVLQGHQKWVTAVAVLDDGRIVSGSSDKDRAGVGPRRRDLLRPRRPPRSGERRWRCWEMGGSSPARTTTRCGSGNLDAGTSPGGSRHCGVLSGHQHP